MGQFPADLFHGRTYSFGDAAVAQLGRPLLARVNWPATDRLKLLIADVRYAADYGFDADIARGLHWAKTGLMHRSKQSSFDYLVGSVQEAVRHCETYGLGGFQIDHKIEFSRLNDWQVGGLGALENSTGVDAGLPVQVGDARPISDQATCDGRVANGEATQGRSDGTTAR